MGGRRAAFKENKDKKEALIERAQTLQHSQDWKSTTEEFKKLQDEWKKIGSADPKDEQKLWQRFRSAADLFFASKPEHFAGIGDVQADNLRLKEELMAEMDAFQLSGNKGEDIATLKSFSERWHAIGFVPKDKLDDVMKRYNKILDVKYGELNEKREASEMNAFRSRMASIKDSSDGDFKLKREKNFLKEKILQWIIFYHTMLLMKLQQHFHKCRIFLRKLEPNRTMFNTEVREWVTNPQMLGY